MLVNRTRQEDHMKSRFTVSLRRSNATRQTSSTIAEPQVPNQNQKKHKTSSPTSMLWIGSGVLCVLFLVSFFFCVCVLFLCFLMIFVCLKD